MSGETPKSKGYIDEEKIATNVASKLIDRLLSGAEQKAREWWAKRKNKDKAAIAAYLADQYSRYSKIKNILYDSDAVDIETLYVETNFSLGSAERKEAQVYTDIDAGKRLVIKATAGAGKSFFMRRTFSYYAKNTSKYLPLFFELRNINDRQQSSLVGHLYQQILLFDKNIMLEQLTSGLEEGIFAIFLDGFDEIDHDKIEQSQKQIIEFSISYPKVPILVSSRPHDSVASWQDFSLLMIKPLSRDAVCEPISKLAFDSQIKNKFINELKAGLYEKHRSFLSIPLLATMMLLTFSETAEIENRLHAFYSDAFNALFYRHDAKKEAFRRPFRCGLPRDQFRALFAAFCMLTYYDQAFQFSEDKCIDYINRASKLQNIQVNSSAYFQDLNIGVCMLVKEGNVYYFSQRSFQEYFAATFVDSCPREKALKLLNELTYRAHFDQTLRLLVEMNSELVEMDWILPKVESLSLKFKKIDAARDPNIFLDRILSLRATRVHASNELRSMGIGLERPDGYTCATICTIYGSRLFDDVAQELFRMFDGRSLPRRRSVGEYLDIDFLEFRDELSANAKLTGKMNKLSEFFASLPRKIRAKYDDRNRRLEEVLLG